jgi:crossover junction endodeoxyribonuclease RuvC
LNLFLQQGSILSSSRILGIDPGSYHLGLGCIEKSGPKFRFVFADVLHAPKTSDPFARLSSLSKQLEYALASLAPDCIAIEDVFYAKNLRSAFQLGMARGVAIGRCLELNVPIHEYSPAQVKSVVTGHGRADKLQVKKMVQLILGVQIEVGLDATDALGVALCHASILRPTKKSTGEPSSKSVKGSDDRVSKRENTQQEF